MVVELQNFLLPEALNFLFVHVHINNLLVEGGARILQSFFRHLCVDQFIVTVVPRWIGLDDNCVVVGLKLDVFEGVWMQFGLDMILMSKHLDSNATKCLRPSKLCAT